MTVVYALHKVVLSRASGSISIAPMTCSNEMTADEFAELSSMGAVREATEAESLLFHLANPPKARETKTAVDVKKTSTKGVKISPDPDPAPAQTSQPEQQSLDLGA